MIAAVLLRLFYLIWHVLGPVPSPAPKIRACPLKAPHAELGRLRSELAGRGCGVPAQPADHDAIERGVGLAIARRG